MNTSASRIPCAFLTLLAALVLVCPLSAQSTTGRPADVPTINGRGTVPAADKLVRFGQVPTPAEARPLIEQYQAEEERFFQERRAALKKLEGRPQEEKLQSMRALLAEQKERRQANRALGARISAMLKKDQESRLPAKSTGNDSR